MATFKSPRGVSDEWTQENWEVLCKYANKMMGPQSSDLVVIDHILAFWHYYGGCRFETPHFVTAFQVVIRSCASMASMQGLQGEVKSETHLPKGLCIVSDGIVISDGIVKDGCQILQSLRGQCAINLLKNRQDLEKIIEVLKTLKKHATPDLTDPNKKLLQKYVEVTTLTMLQVLWFNKLDTSAVLMSILTISVKASQIFGWEGGQIPLPHQNFVENFKTSIVADSKTYRFLLAAPVVQLTRLHISGQEECKLLNAGLLELKGNGIKALMLLRQAFASLQLKQPRDWINMCKFLFNNDVPSVNVFVRFFEKPHPPGLEFCRLFKVTAHFNMSLKFHKELCRVCVFINKGDQAINHLKSWPVLLGTKAELQKAEKLSSKLVKAFCRNKLCEVKCPHAKLMKGNALKCELKKPELKREPKKMGKYLTSRQYDEF